LNIIFDLGGVIVTWQPEAIIAKVFSDPVDQATVRTEIVEHADWLALDRGTLSGQDAIARAVKRTGLSEPDVANFLHRVPLELAAIPGTVDLLYRLRARGHALFCLSNMHLPFIEHLEKAYSFWEVFTGTAISCRLHLLKPEPAIYAHLLNTYSLTAAETIFIDDMDVNLTAASQLGLQTIKFDGPEQCEKRLRDLGCFKNGDE
jgi:putative hydrolase of the HAD superfamily